MNTKAVGTPKRRESTTKLLST